MKTIFGELCAQCKTKTQLHEHRFIVGTYTSPAKQWSYHAPLRHNPEKEVGFCSPECSLTWYQSQNSTEQTVEKENE